MTITEREFKHVRLDKLRYRWEHSDFSQDECKQFTMAYRIAEFRMRHGLGGIKAQKGRLWRLFDSISTDGLKNPLIVKQDGDKYYVIVGNQRLAVLRGYATSIKKPDSWLQIPCVIALPSDSWNDWTEARMFSAPLNEDGESPLDERRHFERLKYALLYEREKDYGMGDRRREQLEDWIESSPIATSEAYEGATWLDVGCGLGETREIAADWSIAWQGAEVIDFLAAPEPGSTAGKQQEPFVDVNTEGIKLIHGVHDLSDYEDRQFDLVTCCDVMEHVLAEDTEPGLAELVRVTKRVLYVAISWESHTYEDIGELHINRHLEEWWVDAFEKAMSESSTLRVFDNEIGNRATFEVTR